MGKEVAKMIGILQYLKIRTSEYYHEVLKTLGIMILISSFVLVKFFSNILYGTSIFTALRSGVIGGLAYLAGCYIICLFASDKNDILKNKTRVDDDHKKKGLVAIILYTLILIIFLVDHIQYVKGLNPILSIIPGYHSIYDIIHKQISVSISTIIYLKPYQIDNIILGNTFFVVIPYLLFKKLGYSFKGVVFSTRTIRASLPILFIYIIRYSLDGLTFNRFMELVYCILYVGLCEEFFDRGIIVRTIASFFKKEGNIIVISSLLFAITHIPTAIINSTYTSIFGVASYLLGIAAYGLILSYGYRKTGTLWPWILVHALEDTYYL